MNLLSGYPTLFSEKSVGSIRLKNRIMHSAITTGMVNDGRISDSLFNYYVNRAKGGAAAIIIQPSNVHSGQIDGRRPDVFSGRYQDSLKKLVSRVEREDCRIFAQLQDSGRGVRETGRNDAALGVSPLPDGISWTVPRALSLSEIQKMIEEMAYSCTLLKDAGFSGVEISAGHGHLFHQFLSPWSNHREDRYGGDLTGRTRVITELVEAIRSETGNDFAVGIKLPASDAVAGSISRGQAKAIAEAIAKSNEIDYWTFCKGTHADSLYQHLPDAHGQSAPYMQEITELRNAAPEIPTAALGYISEPEQAEQILNDGAADLVMLGRTLIADAAWPKKSLEQRQSDIRLCITCNSCWKSVINDGQVRCVNNPRIALEEEVDWVPSVVTRQKHILVVGTGIAGLETAWVAASRGHNVTLVGKNSQAGGKIRLHTRLPGGANLRRIYDYQLAAGEKAKVNLELGKEVDEDYLISLAPDAVVLATGSHMPRPEFLSDDSFSSGKVKDMRRLVRDLDQYSFKRPGTMVIYDHDHTEMTYAAAEYFADIYEKVVLVTPRERIASDVSLMDRQGIYHRLHQKRVEIIASSRPSCDFESGEGQFSIENVYNGDTSTITDVSVLAYSVTRIPNDELFDVVQKMDVEFWRVGDAVSPRTPLVATREGHNLGNIL